MNDCTRAEEELCSVEKNVRAFNYRYSTVDYVNLHILMIRSHF